MFTLPSRIHQRLFVGLTLVLILFASACSKATPGEPAAQPEVSKPPPPPVFPLTAEVAQNQGDLNRRTIGVKIENTVEARPQSGLEKADIVYEEVVEYGITRYLALFQSKLPGEVGPVRSARPVDAQILAQFKSPVLAYSGAIPDITKMIQEVGVQAVTENDESAFKRRRDRKAPHNLYTDGKTLYGIADPNTGPPPPFSMIAREANIPPDLTTTAVSTIDIPFSDMENAKWNWDGASKKWQRSEGRDPATVDGGARITTTNVIVVAVEEEFTKFVDVNAVPVSNWKLTGSGPALAFMDGKRIKGKWSRPNESSAMTLVDPTGRTFALGPGTTWVELMPSDRFSRVKAT